MSPADHRRLDAVIITRNRRLEQERDMLRLALELTLNPEAAAPRRRTMADVE